LKKGDLVNFFTSNQAWRKDYRERNPGVVIASRNPGSKPYDKGQAYILWANGDMTREHMTYLKKAR